MDGERGDTDVISRKADLDTLLCPKELEDIHMGDCKGREGGEIADGILGSVMSPWPVPC